MGCLGCKDAYELGRVFRLAETPKADGVDGRDLFLFFSSQPHSLWNRNMLQ